ncbi:MAG: HAMP domain-containing protein [Sedimentisphaerales bacterium]|nr:HAMP domain-containing protein [Sedimentisphaerales bacterium]
MMSIKYKLITIMMVTCISVVLLAGVMSIIWGNYALRADTIRSLSVQAKIIADKCPELLIAKDAAEARKTLYSLHIEPSISYASINDDKGRVFANYNRDGNSKSIHIYVTNKHGYGFGNVSMNVTEDIIYKNKKIGSVSLQSDLNPLQIMLKRNAIITISTLLLVSVIAYFMSARLQKIISRPIMSLVAITKSISAKKDYSTRVPEHRNDEIGLLMGAFNEMLEQIQHRDSELVNAKAQLEIKVKERTSELVVTNKQLKEEVIERKQGEEKLKAAQNELMEASRQAGMAQVATHVLHNVGNVLNSVNVAATYITEKITQSKLSKLKKAADMLEEHSDNPAEFLTSDLQGKRIPAYMTKVTRILTDEQKEIIGKLESLNKNIGHIKEIVNMQQAYARKSGVEGPVSLSEVVENAIYINTEGTDWGTIKLIREFAELPEVILDRQKVLQILVNLIGNAVQALVCSEKEEKLLTVKFYPHNENTVRIEVSDNGIGIPEENLTRIFRHGFTTKTNGNGFGLHSSALVAKEMDGSISFHSDGPGQGAIFTLELPFKPVEAMAAMATA